MVKCYTTLKELSTSNGTRQDCDSGHMRFHKQAQFECFLSIS